MSGKGVALVLSASVHAVVALAAVRAAPHSALTATLAEERVLELSIEPPLSEPSEAPMKPTVGSASAHASHHHDYPVPASHDAAPHDPSLRHLLPLGSARDSAATAAPAVMDTPAPAAARFLLVVSPTSRKSGSIAAGSGVADGAASNTAAEPTPEASVDTPAKVQTSAAPNYTPEAQAAGIEADIPLEIVVDSGGTVTRAQALSHVGYGLEAAALRSVRAARFLPARRAGKPVAVRMRWLIRFQLR